MTAQIIPFVEPPVIAPECSFCKKEIPSDDFVMVSKDKMFYMCIPCAARAQKRMEVSNDSATEV